MAQPWQQGQPSFQQYPIQTGMPPGFQQQQQQPGFGGGIQPQPTGFPQQRPGGFQQQQPGYQQQPQPSGFQQNQQTGFQQPQQAGFQQPQQTGFQQPQQTGYSGGSMGFQQAGFQGVSGLQQRTAPPPPPVPQIPSRFQGQLQSQLQPSQPNTGMLGGGLQQQRSFLSPSPGPLMPQQTGYGGGGLVPQMTGFVDPRLQMMGTSFMPANLSAPFAPSGLPQFASQPQQGISLQQSIQQHNQNQRGTSTPKIPWALSRAEKKQYDQIFRAWDTQGKGFIAGDTGLQVFGQSGLDKNELAHIWSLADQNDQGKLNLAEFHVAMGLIYRRLNGNELPEDLPAELIPPSARDLDSSVGFLKELLANDGHTRVTNGADELTSRLPTRSFNGASDNANTRKDGTIYRHNEDEVSGYKPPNRHLDRRTVRTGNESPSTDLNEMRRQLENTSKMLEKATAESASHSAEDEALDKEMEDLRYRVRRVQDDLEYVSRGPRSHAKDEERRKLERDLMHLMHERLPDIERRIEERDKRKAREKEEWARSRDRANDKYARFDDSYSSRRERYREEDDDRGYKRGTFDRDDRRPLSRNDERDRDRSRDRDRDYPRRDRSYDRDPLYTRDRGRDSARPRSPPVAERSSPSSSPAISSTPVRPNPPAPTASPLPNTKSMTPEERSAFFKAEAQRRLQERMRALGVASPSSTPSVDSSVEDRLAADRKEAEEKAKQAEKEAEERERARKERVESAKGVLEAKEKPVSPLAPAPAPAGRSKAPPPPPVRKGAARPPVVPRNSLNKSASAPPTSVAPPPPPVPDVDPEEEAIRAREEALRKTREARAARIRQLEEEEAEQRRADEEYAARRAFLEAKATASRAPAPPPPSRTAPRAAPPSPARAVAPAPPPVLSPPIAGVARVPSPSVAAPPPAPPPPPPAPPAPAFPVPSPSSVASPASQSQTNPFNKLMGQGAATMPTPPAAAGGTNPFTRPQPPFATATPPPVKVTYPTAPTDTEDDDWEDLKEKDDEDSSDDEYNRSRGTRDMLAQQIFGGRIATPVIPSPAAPTMSPPPPPPAPAAPEVAVALPPPPPAPPAPSVATNGAPPADRNALFSQITGGMPKLRKAVTNDRSAAAVAGSVLGDTAPPPHIGAQLPPPPLDPIQVQPPVQPVIETDAHTLSRHGSRQSVDWYANLAADGSTPPHLPSTTEEDEEEFKTPIDVPDIQLHVSPPNVDSMSALQDEKNQLEDIDQETEYRVRTLYPYQGQRAEDLGFDENVIMTAHPSKTGSEWWYGTISKTGKSGFFPSTYVQELENVKSKALYSYTGENADELPFVEGDELTIIDRSGGDWWKTEKDGIIFIVPAAYLEVIASDKDTPSFVANTPKYEVDVPSALPDVEVSANTDNDNSSDENSSNQSSSDDDDYLSFEGNSDSDGNVRTQTEEERQTEYKAREFERQRVLQAAGLIVKRDSKTPPPPPVRKKSTRRQRPAPVAPDHSSRKEKSSSTIPQRELPPIPVEEELVPTDVLRVDDAFERYESYKQKLGPRTSIASSFDSIPPSAVDTLSSGHSRSQSKEESRYSGLLSFLGRRTPAGDSDRRSNLSSLVISSPIMNAPLSPSRENSPAFGSSWSSLVDKTALEGIPSDERRRQEAIFELIATESAYVRNLQLIVETFYASMIRMLDQKAITVIFANIEDILLTNTTFLSLLEERQKDCRLYIDNIGDLVKIQMSRMGVYRQYCVNTGAAIKILQSLRDSKPELAAHLQRLRDDPKVRGLDLASYLLTPMQRITRYPLLLRQIFGQTNHQPERNQLQDSITEVERVLDAINESIREQEGHDRLRQISQTLWIDQGRLDLTQTTRYMGARKLLKEGPLWKTKSGRKLNAFLCSDILVLTDNAARSLYRMPIPLSELQVQDGNGRQDLDFKIVLAYPRGGDVIHLRASSARDAQNWMTAIEQGRTKCIKAEQRASQRR